MEIHRSNIVNSIKSRSKEFALRILLNANPLRDRSRSLGDHDTQDAVLETSLDILLVYAGRKAECALELADGALGDPVAALVLWLPWSCWCLCCWLSDGGVVCGRGG